jgi:hypothetical protein
MIQMTTKSGFKSSDRDVRDLRFRLELAFWRGYKRLKHQFSPADDKLCLFVVGAQRSGTNMLMECLDWSTETDVFHESDPRAFKDYQMLDRQVIHGLVQASRFPRIPIKALCEAEQTRALLDEFAPAKAIWVVRDYEDTVNSAMRNFPDFSARIQEIVRDPKTTPGWFARGISDETLNLLRTLNHADMTSATASALRWYIRNVLFFEQGLDLDDRVLVVQYANLVTRPAPTLETVFDFAGLGDFSSFVTRKVHARSIRKNAPPPIDPGVAQACASLQQRFSSLGALD